MDLYYNPLSTYSHKAMMALYEKNVAFNRKVVNLMDPSARAEYEKIYPIGKVPVLFPKADHLVPESTIIIEYLEGHHPGGTRLIPEGVDESRRARFMDRCCDMYLNDPVVDLLFAGMKPPEKRDEDALAKARKFLGVTYNYLNDMLGKQTWMCGEAFTMADCAAIPPLFYAPMIMPFASYPNIVAYYERAKQRPSYKKVLEELVPAWEAMQKMMAAKK